MGLLAPVLLGRLEARDLTCTTEPSPGEPDSEDFLLPPTGDGTTFGFRLLRFDLEDAFPIEDGAFDVVLLCEVLEHLKLDPVHVLSEINRVLRPGGRLLLTTPNCASSASALRLLLGRNPYAYSCYPRDRARIRDGHHREYAPREIASLLEGTGFRLDRIATRDVHPGNGVARTILRGVLAPIDRLRPVDGAGSGLRGDTILAVAERTGPVTERHPDFLYQA